MSKLLRAMAGVAALLLMNFAARAEPFRNVIDDLDQQAGAPLSIERVHSAARAELDRALAEADAVLRERPYDVAAHVGRCRLLDEFAANYEYAQFATNVADQAQTCTTQVAERYPDHPETSLWTLRRSFGDEQLQEAEELLRSPQLERWTQGQRARLYAMLAQTADARERAEQALTYALRALELDDEADVRLIAASRLLARGDRVRALEVLESHIDGAAPENGWALTQKMTLLVELGAHARALELYPRLAAAENYDHTEAARVLRRAGALELARGELKKAVEAGLYSTEDEKERFRFELEHGSADEAFAAYTTWRDGGWLQDPIAINRMALAWRDLSLPWRARDLLGVLGFFLATALVASVAILPIALVHYRGLAVRAKSGAPYPHGAWGLSHGWYALFAFGMASVLCMYSAGSIDVFGTGLAPFNMDATPAQLARMTLVESLLAIALLLPLAASAKARTPILWSEHWSIGKALAIGAAIGLALRAPLLLAWAAKPDAVKMLAPDDYVWQLMGGIRDQFGVAAALWVIVVAAPVIEELIFRGVLYRSFSAHLRPIWANALQATLFSAIHLNLKGAVYLFIVGLVLGALTRRSGGLLAAMIMHAVFNLIACAIFL